MQRGALEAMSEAVLAIAAEREVEPVLRRLVRSARELAGARYAALGIPDGAGAFAQFVTAGMSDEEIAAMGPLPRTHGLLGAMLESPEPFRTPDVHEHPRFRGWWPRAHPDMRSFLGVPIVARGAVIAAFYLTDKEGADEFDAEDERLIEMLAAHAAVAPARADVDGGARPRAGRDAGRRLPPRRGDDRHARGAAMIRVLIADDHAVVRQGLRTFLDLQDDIEVVGEAADGEEALAAALRTDPDVVLVDLVMPRVDGGELIRRLRDEAPGARAIVLTSYVDDDRVFGVIRAG